MLILRLIGRILSIGFILFIAFIASGKNAGAQGTRAVCASAYQDCDADSVESVAVPVRPEGPRG